ncbi:MAG: tetratricopeptide repeat protein [Chromatiales bacterium]|nr:tetratricopeptide repeat protein [Chromatiales bacterium]
MKFKRSNLESKSYLVVDDFGDMRSLIKNMLLSCGAGDIVAAMNGAQAIKAMERKRFDVVLCDYNLGSGKDGQQVLEEARHRQLIGLGTVFVMITAENTREMVMGAVEYEPDSYLTKPFNKELLRSRLEKLLAKKQDLLPIEKAVENRDFTLALELLNQKIAESPPNIGELNKLKGEICLQAGEVEEALVVYDKVLAVREMPWARLGLGKALFGAKRYAEARVVFQDLVNANDRYTAAYDWLAKTCKCLNQHQDAQDILQKAAKLSPRVITRQQALGELALSNNDVNTAEAAFSNAVKFGKHSVYKHPSVYANLAKVVAENKTGGEGLKVLKDMQREFADDSEAEFYNAAAESVIQRSMGDSEKSEQALERALEEYQKLGKDVSSEYSIELAKTYTKLGDPDKATELFHQAVRNNHSDEELLSELGATMQSLGLQEDPSSLISEIRKEIIRLNNKGVELAREGKLKESISLFEEAAEGMSGNKVVNLNAARVLLMDIEQNNNYAGKINRVRVYLDRVKALDPDNQTLRKLNAKFQEIVGT